jgi:hypothetical protein
MEVTPQPPVTGRDAIGDLPVRVSTTSTAGEILAAQKPRPGWDRLASLTS